MSTHCDPRRVFYRQLRTHQDSIVLPASDSHLAADVAIKRPVILSRLLIALSPSNVDKKRSELKCISFGNITFDVRRHHLVICMLLCDIIIYIPYACSNDQYSCIVACLTLWIFLAQYIHVICILTAEKCTFTIVICKHRQDKAQPSLVPFWNDQYSLKVNPVC